MTAPADKIGYAIWDVSAPEVPTNLHQRLCEITQHFIKLKSPDVLQFARDHSLSRLLHEQSEHDREWCAVFLPGTILQSGFFKVLGAAILEANSRTLGYKKDRHFLLVNLKAWQAQGSPRINWLSIQDELPEAVAQKLLLLHDDTPKTDVTLEQRNVLRHFRDECRDSGDLVFLFNNEGYHEVNVQNPKPRLDGLFTVASGFKDLYILDRHGFNTDAKITYFDYCASALTFKKYIYEHWDGYDFPTFFASINFDRPPELYGMNFAEPEHKLQSLWERELQLWGGPEPFHRAFQVARSLPKNYLQINILEEPERLSQLISASPGQSFALWYSNCFNYTPAWAQYQWDSRWIETQGLSFLRALNAVAHPVEKRILLYGEDVIRGSRCFRASPWAHEVFD